MTKEGEGRFEVDYFKKKVGSTETYSRNWIFIPAKVATDSEFPFKRGDRLKIYFKGKKVITEFLSDEPSP